MNTPLFKRLLLVGFLALSGTDSASAQASSSPEKVYTMVIGQPPELPGGGGLMAISNAIQRQIVYPPKAEKDIVEGRVFVSFTVSSIGVVHDIRVVKGLRFDCDSVVVRAVKMLPRFKPGREAGAPVAVSFTVPVTFRLEEAEEPKKTKRK